MSSITKGYKATLNQPNLCQSSYTLGINFSGAFTPAVILALLCTWVATYSSASSSPSSSTCSIHPGISGSSSSSHSPADCSIVSSYCPVSATVFLVVVTKCRCSLFLCVLFTVLTTSSVVTIITQWDLRKYRSVVWILSLHDQVTFPLGYSAIHGILHSVDVLIVLACTST